MSYGFDIIMDGAAAASFGALAAVALSNPIGAAGGALGAALGSIAGRSVSYLAGKLLHTDERRSTLTSTIAEIAKVAIILFVYDATFMLAGSIVGAPITFEASCALTGAIMGITLGLGLIIPAIGKVLRPSYA